MKREDFLASAFARFVKDIPFVLYITFIQAIIAALWPESGIAFHFGKMLFLLALVKAFGLGVILSLLSFGKKWLQWLIVLIHICVLEIYVYLAIQFNVRVTTNVVALVLQTNPGETSEFFQQFFPLSTILLLSAVFMCAIAIWGILIAFGKIIQTKARMVKQHAKIACLVAICSLTIISLAINIVTDCNYLFNKRIKVINQILYDTTLPHQDLMLSFTSIGSNSQKVKRIKQANDNIVIDSCNFDCSNVVLVIGESYIKSHASIYGYRHQTTPFMEESQRDGNLFVFSDVVTHSGGTSVCMQYFYSTKSINDNRVWEDSPLLPAIFKKAGYSVTLLDNQSTRYSGTSTLDYSTSFFINPAEIHEQCFNYRNENVYKYDLEMLNAEKHIITQQKSKHTFTIIHLFGQHFGASGRYPNDKENTIFTTDSVRRRDISDSDMLQEIAHYDNATHYNDLVFKEICDLYSQKETVILYVSDHGECVYDTSALTYGRPLCDSKSMETIKVIYEIPMMIWCSDLFKERHSEMVDKIKSSINRPFMNDDVCHILFDVAGIRGKFFDASRSVVNEDFVARDRIINGSFNYDVHKADISAIKLKSRGN